MKKLLIIALIPYLITGCATTYHKQNLFGGYSEQKFEKDIYQVGFDASLFTDKDMIEQFIQYRSAEIVIEQGYKYYTIINNYTYTSPNTVTIKIFEEKPESINVRDATEVVANLKDIVNSRIPIMNYKALSVIAFGIVLYSVYANNALLYQ